MNKFYFLLFTIFITAFSFGQTTGDIAFIGINVDGEDDFAIVALNDIPANTTIYFSDDELNGTGGFVDSNEGNLQWDTPNTVINAGTVVVFSDTDSDSNAGFGVSLGSLTYVGSGTVNLSSGGDALFAYLGSDQDTPTTFLAGIQNEAGNEGDLTGSGLVDGTTFFTFTFSGSPDGGAYSGPRDSETSFTDYILLISNPNNWTLESSNGENILPFDTTSFIEAATATPTVSGGPSVSGLQYFEGNPPSSEGTFRVDGLNLNDDLIITAPTNFEVSLSSGTGFSASINISNAGVVSNQTIYVRLVSGLTNAGSPYSGNVTISSTGAVSKSVSVSGLVSPATPLINTSGGLSSFSYTLGNGPSASDNFTASGIFLEEDITITAPTNFEVSLDDSNFSSSVTLDGSSGTVNSTIIYARLAQGLAVNSYSGDITLTSLNATDRTISVTGDVSPSAVCSGVGEVIITEIMQNPSASGSDPAGEYFELYNTTASPIDIAGWVIKDDTNTSETHTIGQSVIIPAMGYIVIGNVLTTSPALDYNYGNDISLGNTTDGIIIECSSITIDEVIWDDGNTFPDPSGASMELSTTAMNSTDNDNGGNWGVAISNLGNGDLGTPKATNDFALSTKQNQIAGFSMYPNPTATGNLNILSKSNADMSVQVFDILGKQVINKQINDNRLDVSNLKAGIYILKASQKDATTSKKLVIQ